MTLKRVRICWKVREVVVPSQSSRHDRTFVPGWFTALACLLVGGSAGAALGWVGLGGRTWVWGSFAEVIGSIGVTLALAVSTAQWREANRIRREEVAAKRRSQAEMVDWWLHRENPRMAGAVELSMLWDYTLVLGNLSGRPIRDVFAVVSAQWSVDAYTRLSRVGTVGPEQQSILSRADDQPESAMAFPSPERRDHLP